MPDDAEQSNARTIAEKYCRQFSKLEPQLRRQRVLSRLQARGFAYDTSIQAFDAVEAAEEETE